MKNTTANIVANIASTTANEQAFLALFNESPEGKALAEQKAKEEAERLERAAARRAHIEHNIEFIEKMFDVSLPGLAELIEKICWPSTGAPRKVGKFFLVSNKDFPNQREINKDPLTLADENYLVKLGDFDKKVGAPKVIISDAKEGGPIDQAVSKKKSTDAAAAKAKAAEAHAAELAAQKEAQGHERVQKLKNYMALIGQETDISFETAEFLKSNIPNCSREFKASREEVLSYHGSLDSRSFPDKIPEEGPFAILAPVTRHDERRDTLFIYVPELDARKALAFQLKKFLSTEQVSCLMENLVGDENSWYGFPWIRRGNENFLAYAEGVAKALRLKNNGQIAYDLLQGVVKVAQPAGKGGKTYIMVNPKEASCFTVEKSDGKVVLNLYLPD